MRGLGLVLIVVGACLLIFGIQEFRVGADASPDPVEVDLADLEAGKPLPDPHVKVGLHHELYGSSVVEYQDKDSGLKKSTPLNWTYCPMVSDKHPTIVALRAVEKKYGSLAKTPQAEKPRLANFVMLLKTERYDTYGDVPNGRKYFKSATGLVINKIEPLGDEEKRLIRKRFPKIDFDKVMVLEEWRKPTSRTMSWGFMIGGGVVALAGLGLVFRRQRQPALPVEEPAPAAEPTAEPEAEESEPSNPYGQQQG